MTLKHTYPPSRGLLVGKSARELIGAKPLTLLLTDEAQQAYYTLPEGKASDYSTLRDEILAWMWAIQYSDRSTVPGLEIFLLFGASIVHRQEMVTA